MGVPLPPERNEVRVAEAAPTVCNDAKPDVTKQMVNCYILEEMAKLIAAKPMNMSDGSEEEGEQGGLSLSSAAFQGSDWSVAMTRMLTKDTAPTAEPPRARAADAMSTYDMLNAVPTIAPLIPPRRDR